VTRAVLALGSNLGDRVAHLRSAVRGLGDAVLVVSGVYESPAWDPGAAVVDDVASSDDRGGRLESAEDDETRERVGAGQPAYLNAVLLVADPIGPREWLERARALETIAGRVRDPGWRYGPRTLDVDVIAVWEDDGTAIVSDDPELTLPHPRAHQRAFVLRPWLDIAPYAELPGYGAVASLLTRPGLGCDLEVLHPWSGVDLDRDDLDGTVEV
jgi:2-amino-4-hydroxy-6-hydroxymethyldihydropteridine diphosphokinase